jgi:hypothetical protein
LVGRVWSGYISSAGLYHYFRFEYTHIHGIEKSRTAYGKVSGWWGESIFTRSCRSRIPVFGSGFKHSILGLPVAFFGNI